MEGCHVHNKISLSSIFPCEEFLLLRKRRKEKRKAPVLILLKRKFSCLPDELYDAGLSKLEPIDKLSDAG